MGSQADLAAVDRVSAAAVSHAFADMGMWVRTSNYKLTPEEWVWLNEARMGVLRRQVTYAGVTFCGVLAATHVKFSIGNGPPRRMPGWTRWGIAGTAAWMVSGLGKLSGYRWSMKRLMLIPDSALGAHMRSSLSLPALPNQQAGFATEFADPAGGFVAQPAPRSGGASKEEREQQLPTGAGFGASGRNADASFQQQAPDAADAMRPQDGAVHAAKASRPSALGAKPNSWDRVRKEKLEQRRQQQQLGSAAGPRGQRSDELQAAQMGGDGSVEAGLARVLPKKNRWGDKTFSDTLD